MMHDDRSVLHRLYRWSKGWFNYLLDRAIDLSDMFLMDAYRFPWPGAQNGAHWVARYVGDLSWLLRDFPRLSAYKFTGANWTIVFVGADQGLLEIGRLFFLEENVVPQEIGRVALWHLSAKTQHWLAERVDLVICELSRIYPRLPRAAIAFTVPTWIHQALTLPEPLEALLSGNHAKSVRHNLNRASKAGFSWHYSQAETDFDYFYNRMYVPYIKNRHGQRALLATYEDQRKRWFVRGGLIVVTQNNKPVGGVICYVRGDTCFAIEMGILDSDPELIQQGIKISSDWFAMNWAYQQGARVFNMGATRPWRSDGVFISKSRWRAKVVRRRKICSAWTFLAQNLSPSLQAHLNKLGFISEIDGKFYGAYLSTDTHSITEVDLRQELLATENQGLDGLAVVTANSKPIIYTRQT